MARRIARSIAVVAAAVGLLGGVASYAVAAPAVSLSAPSSAAATAAPPAETTFMRSKDAMPGIAPPDADKTAVYLGSAGQVIAVTKSPSAGPDAAQIGCTPVSGRDNPHRSSTGVAASGHGWWGKGNCSSDRANVYNCLYEWYTNNSWRQITCSGVKELRPATGGSSDRTVARADCDSTLRTSWRNHVDVDVIDEIDTGEQPYNQGDVDCRVH